MEINHELNRSLVFVKFVIEESFKLETSKAFCLVDLINS